MPVISVPLYCVIAHLFEQGWLFVDFFLSHAYQFGRCGECAARMHDVCLVVVSDIMGLLAAVFIVWE